MNFQIEYIDGENSPQIIHLVSKNNYDALNESQEIVRTLSENKIYKWSLIAKMDRVIYE